MNITVILSGGSGERFGGDVPKQYAMLDKREVIAYPITAAKNSAKTDKVIVVAHEAYDEHLTTQYAIECVRGGRTHNESVKNALNYIMENKYHCKNILFLDAARPFVTEEIIDKYFELLSDYDAVITTQHITDSLGKGGEQFVKRDDFFLIQKPEAFIFQLLYKYFDVASTVTAIIQQLPVDVKCYNCFNEKQNMKITYPNDMKIAEQLLKIRGEL